MAWIPVRPYVVVCSHLLSLLCLVKHHAAAAVAPLHCARSAMVACVGCNPIDKQWEVRQRRSCPSHVPITWTHQWRWSCWIVLGVIGCLWMLLDVGCCWMLLDVVGCCWVLLGVAGCCWMSLNVTECWIHHGYENTSHGHIVWPYQADASQWWVVSI